MMAGTDNGEVCRICAMRMAVICLSSWTVMPVFKDDGWASPPLLVHRPVARPVVRRVACLGPPVIFLSARSADRGGLGCSGCCCGPCVRGLSCFVFLTQLSTTKMKAVRRFSLWGFSELLPGLLRLRHGSPAVDLSVYVYSREFGRIRRLKSLKRSASFFEHP